MNQWSATACCLLQLLDHICFQALRDVYYAQCAHFHEFLLLPILGGKEIDDWSCCGCVVTVSLPVISFTLITSCPNAAFLIHCHSQLNWIEFRVESQVVLGKRKSRKMKKVKNGTLSGIRIQCSVREPYLLLTPLTWCMSNSVDLKIHGIKIFDNNDDAKKKEYLFWSK